MTPLFGVGCADATQGTTSAESAIAEASQDRFIDKYGCNPISSVVSNLPGTYVIPDAKLPPQPTGREASTNDLFVVAETGERVGSDQLGTLEGNPQLELVNRFARFSSSVTGKTFRIFRKVNDPECASLSGVAREWCSSDGLLNILQGVAMSTNREFGAVISNGEGTSDVLAIDLRTGNLTMFFTAAAHMTPFDDDPTNDQVQFIDGVGGQPHYLAFRENYVIDHISQQLISFVDLLSSDLGVRRAERISVRVDQIIPHLAFSDFDYPNPGDTVDRRLFHAVDVERLFADVRSGALSKTRVKQTYYDDRPECPL